MSVAARLMLRIPEEEVVRELIQQGTDPAIARRQVARASARVRRAQRAFAIETEKLAWLFKVTGRLRALRQAPGTIAARETIDAATFLADYYSRNEPLLLTALTREWPARRWTPDFFRQRYGDAEVEVLDDRLTSVRRDEEWQAHRRRCRFAEFIDRVERGAGDECYLVANNRFFADERFQELLPDLAPLPPFLDPGAWRETTHFWLGAAGTATHLHHDVLNILFVQLHGRKRFRLFPPDAYFTIYNEQGVWSANREARRDDPRFPYFDRSESVDLTLAPGDALFIPVGWWHHVEALDVSISVSFTNFTYPNEYVARAR